MSERETVEVELSPEDPLTYFTLRLLVRPVYGEEDAGRAMIGNTR